MVRRLGRALRNTTHPVSAPGAVALVVGVVLVVVGWDRGWVELTVPGATLLGTLLCALLLTVGRSTFAVTLDLSGNRVTVGERAVGRITVRNTSRRRLLPAQIELPVGRGAADFHLPSLGPDQVHEEVFAVPTTRRAVVVVGPVRSVRGDPLGLMRRRVRWTDPVDLYVHPLLVSLQGAASGVLRDLEGQSTRSLSDSDMSFHALRDYVAGDDRRHIHWKSSARVGQLMVRQFEDTRRTHTALAVSTALADYTGEAEFELAVAAAASIGVQALRDERELTVLAGQGALRTRTPPVLLDDFAGVEATVTGRGSSELAPWVARQAGDASVAILVVGSVPTRADLRAHTIHLPAGIRTLVLTCSPGARLEVHQHGALSLATLGSLDDLPRVLRRVVAG
ncbi:hypothetical protein N869_02230 [Cellulomonas bogoriensis 69B4 = DSM 16987]|uniref:DUF58 domain-containing protein n=1 Tax=Cellulomonas bogoriensis 69B4 = DSM 16987 TaxID=1386082 RepID=A0A0A0BW93_9CELL|nr:hypothetical protein N869_02230 [Cellulomonas bogoriensis 69B4 = DSM 16987]